MSDNREQLQEEIKVQGEVVRKLKAAKEPKAKVSQFGSDEIFVFAGLLRSLGELAVHLHLLDVLYCKVSLTKL